MTRRKPQIQRAQRRVTRADISDWVVLVVDDQMDNLSLAQAALSFHGASVHTARNGDLALQMLDDIAPSLILLDLSMPVMDGWKMFAELRADSAYDDVPIIALTAHAMAGDKERVMEAGFSGYIAKPFSVATLVLDIQNILAKING